MSLNRMLVAFAAGLVVAATVAADEPVEPVEVSLFPAIDDGQIEVELIAHDFSRLSLRIKNKTRQELRVELPRVFAAAPVESPGGQYSPQSLGGSFGDEESGEPDARGVSCRKLAIGPGRVIREKLDCFCLEFGKPNPHPRIPYALVPLEQVTDSLAVRELLESYGRGKQDQRATQLAAWHVANGVDWESLARIRVARSSGRSATGYTRREIEEAMKIVDHLAAKAGSLSGDGNLPDRDGR